MYLMYVRWIKKTSLNTICSNEAPDDYKMRTAAILLLPNEQEVYIRLVALHVALISEQVVLCGLQMLNIIISD